MEQLLKKVAQIIRNNKKQKWVHAGVMSVACLVVFMTTYLLILPAITISLDQADEEPGFDVASQGELLLSDEDQGGIGDTDALTGSNGSGNGEQPTSDDEENASSLFGEADGENDEVFFTDSDETAGPFEYTYKDEDTEWKVSVELLEGATLPSDAQFTAQFMDPVSEVEQDMYKHMETTYAEALKDSNFEAAVEPDFYQLAFEKDGVNLITEDTFAPARITFQFCEAAPEGDTTIATGEYNSLTEEAKICQTLLIPEKSCYTIIADIENAASIIGVAKVRKTEEELHAAPETEAENIAETEVETATSEIAETETTEIIEAETVEETGEETEENTEAIENVYEDEIGDETESIAEVETEAETEAVSEAVAEAEELLSVLTYEGADYTVQLTYGADAEIPEDAFVEVREIEKGSEEYNIYLTASGIALENEGKENGSAENVEARFFDITIMDGDQKIEPKAQVSVDISYHEALPVAENGEVNAVHFDDNGETSVLEANPQGEGGELSSVSFDTDSFSVFGIVYTVDFHYEINGKTYEFSIPGGGFVSLEHVVEELGIASADENNMACEEAIKLNEVVVSETTKKFVADVERVEFSNPELVWVGKVDSEITVGRLKETNGLEIEYSADLTEEQIEMINAQTVVAGDWGLISLHSFTSEEMLTVTMKNGDQWTIRVTDYVNGAYGQSVNIDIYGDGSITLGEYVHLFDWDWWGTYDSEERKTYYSYRTLNLSVRYGTNTNNQDIVANPASGYTFDHWELTDGSSGNVTTYTSAVIPAGTASFSHGSTLTAVFSKSSGGGSVEPIDFNQITQEWIEKITKDQPVVDKTASVYDYDNRIYQIDITSSSELYAVNQNLDIDFVTDVSGSMHFPSKLDTVSTFNNAGEMAAQLDNVVRQNHNGTLPQSTPVGELYYMILDPQGASNVFILRRYNGQWWALPGDKLEEINLTEIRGRGYDTWRPLNVADNDGTVVYTNLSYPNPDGNGTYNPIVEKKIYMATDSTLRILYLQQALFLARDVLYKINPDAQIGLTTFAATANQGRFYGSDEQAALTTAIETIATKGGTNQAEGLAAGKALLDSDSDTTKKKIAVLITDGAPNGCTWDQILQNAQNMKDNDIDVYTVGLSVENVQGASDGLFHTSNGAGYAYDAKDGRGLVEAIESIIESVVKQANMVGSVSDTIDSAFYPVAKDGTPLQAGVEYEDENGHKYTLTQNGETWTVNWDDQSFGWAYTDTQGKQPGWKGTVYVKAKENFLGGNTIKTNSDTNNDKVTVTGFETFTYNDDDELVILNRGDLKDENGQSRTVTKTLDTPYVNVDELALTENDTEWKVYLGTEVDPKSALEELLKKIDIRKVVSGDTNEMITSKDQMLGGTSDSSKTMALTDYLLLASEDQVQALVNELLANGSKTYQYNDGFASAYGHGYVGDIVITLEGTSGCYNKDNHVTEAVGTDAEFTLKVEYRPRTNTERNGELEITAEDYHTTPGGSAGESVPKTANDMTSSNHHIITVYVKGLQITKKDQTFTDKLTGAEFKLYRTARAGESTNLKEINGKQFFPITTLDMTSGSVAGIDQIEALKDGEEYYLIETKAPVGYLILVDPVPVNLELVDTYTSKPGDTPSPVKPSGIYDWTQSARLTLGASGWIHRTDDTGENDLTHVALDPNSENEMMYYDIANDAGVSLPSTGGPGTNMIYLLGITLLGLAGTGIASKKIRRNAA